MKHIAGAIVLSGLLSGGCTAGQAGERSSPRVGATTRRAATSAPTSRPTAYRPGVRINWSARQVELEAEVVLREGALELLACSPQTKEHESILRVSARPLHIYEALGLIGLTPGRPVGWDKKNERVIPPSGERLALRVRYREGRKTRTVPVREWLRNTTTPKPRPMPPLSWLFAGSQRLEDGTFYADVDGTVVAVVDFSSSLITVAGVHSADNAQLWLEPRTARIPPVGTRCVLLIGAAVQE